MSTTLVCHGCGRSDSDHSLLVELDGYYYHEKCWEDMNSEHIHVVTAVKPDSVSPISTKVETFGPFLNGDVAAAWAVKLSDEIKAEWIFVAHTVDIVLPTAQAAEYLLNLGD